MGRLSPNQNSASTGGRASVRTPPAVDAFHTSQAAHEAARVTARNASKSKTKTFCPNRADQRPPYISKRSKKRGSLPCRRR
jgi:hypothetical protein